MKPHATMSGSATTGRRAACEATFISASGAVEALRGATARMRARCDASIAHLVDTVPRVVTAVVGQRRALGPAVADRVKALDADAEAWRVTADQLTASAVVLQGMEMQDSPAGVTDAVAALCASAESNGRDCTPSCASLRVPRADLDAAITVRVRSSVSAGLSTARGTGLRGYVCGDSDAAAANNGVDVCVADEWGEAVECEESDVEAVCVTGGAVTVGMGRGVGLIRVEYRVPDGTLFNITLTLRVYGTLVAGAPWSIRVCRCVCV